VYDFINYIYNTIKNSNNNLINKNMKQEKELTSTQRLLKIVNREMDRYKNDPSEENMERIKIAQQTLSEVISDQVDK